MLLSELMLLKKKKKISFCFLYSGKFLPIRSKNFPLTNKSEWEFIVLPIITEEQSSLVFAEIFQDVHAWRKRMIHYIKEENPEINSAIIEAANNTELDPKAVALGAYMTYILLETALKEESEDDIALRDFTTD